MTMLPFVDTFTLHLTASERDVITRAVVGNGGHQQLLRDCCQQLRDDALTLDALTLDRVAHYAYDYGGGGYQHRFRTLLSAARRAGWREV